LHAEEEVVGERSRLGALYPPDRQVGEREQEVEHQEEAAQGEQIEPPWRAQQVMVDIAERRLSGADDQDLVRVALRCRHRWVPVVSTTGNRDPPLSMRSQGSATGSGGNTSFIERPPVRSREGPLAGPLGGCASSAMGYLRLAS